jgi:hypothetical protein
VACVGMVLVVVVLATAHEQVVLVGLELLL